jgi:hypothetical protein
MDRPVGTGNSIRSRKAGKTRRAWERAPGTTDLVENILAGYAYHLNVMPLDANMPDAAALVRATDVPVPAWDQWSASYLKESWSLVR